MRNTAMQRQLVMATYLQVESVIMKIHSSLSSRKCAFEFFLKKLEQMYMDRPTEDLGIDSILVFQYSSTYSWARCVSVPPT